MQNPYEDFASQVSHQISTDGLQAAYSSFTHEITNRLSTLPFAEKQAEWGKYSKALEDNGALPKLAAEFLIENGKSFDQADGKADGLIHKDTLLRAEAATLNPMTKDLEQQALKQFDTIAGLHQADGVIDAGELSSYKDRQMMQSADRFAEAVAQKAQKDLEQSPDTAVKDLFQSMASRAAMETLPEREATWKTVLADLQREDPNVIGKLSMSWLRNYTGFIDQNPKDGQISLTELEPFAKSRFPMTRDFAQYVKTNFNSIATVEGYNNFDKISANEMNIYQAKMFHQ